MAGRRAQPTSAAAMRGSRAVLRTSNSQPNTNVTTRSTKSPPRGASPVAATENRPVRTARNQTRTAADADSLASTPSSSPSVRSSSPIRTRPHARATSPDSISSSSSTDSSNHSPTHRRRNNRDNSSTDDDNDDDDDDDDLRSAPVIQPTRRATRPSNVSQRGNAKPQNRGSVEPEKSRGTILKRGRGRPKLTAPSSTSILVSTSTSTASTTASVPIANGTHIDDIVEEVMSHHEEHDNRQEHEETTTNQNNLSIVETVPIITRHNRLTTTAPSSTANVASQARSGKDRSGKHRSAAVSRVEALIKELTDGELLEDDYYVGNDDMAISNDFSFDGRNTMSMDYDGHDVVHGEFNDSTVSQPSQSSRGGLSEGLARVMPATVRALDIIRSESRQSTGHSNNYPTHSSTESLKHNVRRGSASNMYHTKTPSSAMRGSSTSMQHHHQQQQQQQYGFDAQMSSSRTGQGSREYGGDGGGNSYATTRTSDREVQLLREELEVTRNEYDELLQKFEELGRSVVEDSAKRFESYKRATDKRIAALEDYNKVVRESAEDMARKNEEYVTELRKAETKIAELKEAKIQAESKINEAKQSANATVDDIKRYAEATINEHKSKEDMLQEELYNMRDLLKEQRDQLAERDDRIAQQENLVAELEMMIENERAKLSHVIDEHAKDEMRWMNKTLEEEEKNDDGSGANKGRLQYQRALNRIIKFYEALTGMTVTSIQRELQVDSTTGDKTKELVYRCSHHTETCGVFEYKLAVGENGVYTYQPILEEIPLQQTNVNEYETQEAPQTTTVVAQILSRFEERGVDPELIPTWLAESVEFEDTGKFFWRLLDYLQTV